MGSFQIEGGHKLDGVIIPQGAKNEALQILCAVLLTKEKITSKTGIFFFNNINSSSSYLLLFLIFN